MSSVPPTGPETLEGNPTGVTGTVPATQRTALASVSLIGARLVSRGIDFVSLLILARLLTPADFGVVAVAMSLILIVEAVFELPVGQVLLVEKSVNRGLLDTAFTLSILRGAVLAMLVGAVAWPFSIFYQDPRLLPLICALALAPAARGIQNPNMIVYDRALDFKRQISIDVTSKVVSCLLSGLLAYFTRSYWALAGGTVLTPLLSLMMSFALVPYRPRLTLVEWRLFSGFLGWLSAGQIFSALTWQVDRLVLGWAMSKPEVGRFTIADNLSALPTQILLNPVVGPLSVSLSQVRDDEQRLQRAYLKLMSIVAMVGFPALTGLALLADPFVRVALGPAWGNAGEILRWLALAAIPGLMWTPFNTLALATKRSWLIFSRQVFDFIVKVPAAIGLILTFGLIGACMARGIATTVIGIASLFAARKITAIPIRTQLQAMARPALGTGIMTALLFWPVTHLFTSSGLPLTLAIMAGIGLVGGVIYLSSLGILWKAAGSPDGGETFLFSSLAHIRSAGRRNR
jgi:O-antigen/teichoic acid export membrane protein